MRAFSSFAAVAVAAAVLSSCTTDKSGPAKADLDQSWTPQQIKVWYEASQGSRLLPLSWARALEMADGAEPFLGAAHVERLRYLPNPDTPGLPVGFVVDRTPSKQLGWTAMTWRANQPEAEPWLGLNCSACHTGEVSYGGKSLRIQGGQGLGDFQTLMSDLRAALVRTRDDPAKFDRFAKAVLTGKDAEGRALDTPENRDRLGQALAKLVDHELALGQLNQTDLKYGYGRLDAFGHIYNKVAYVVAGKDAPPQPSDAPVSYPFLWNVTQHDVVQWNGIAPNKALPGVQPFDILALGRNAGEVIGVFADVQPRAGYLKGYRSSLNIHNLSAFEQQLGGLRPPAWPADVFGVAPNHDQMVANGRAIFTQHCSSCHAMLDRTDLKTPIVAKMSLFKSDDPPKTDIWMACNAYTKAAPSGVLKGTPSKFFSGDPLEDEEQLSSLLATTVTGALFDQKGAIVRTAAASFFGVNRPARITAPTATLTEKQRLEQRCLTEASNILGYKARPLTGIWATPPYLHNGSVPTLYDLLLPEAQRPKTFLVGARAFDPKKVGYVYTQAPGNDFTFDTKLPGNSNAGHTYASGIFEGPDGETRRWELVEYMKTL